MKYNVEEVNQLIRERRSVFQKDYSGEIIPDAVIEQILENANWAPTHKLTEPWRFIVYAGAGLKKLGDFQADCYKNRTQPKGTFDERKYIGFQTKPLESSHVIAVSMKREPKQSLPAVEELGAVFCAIQNMYLTATAYGVGGYLSTGGITYYEEAKEFFGLEKDDVFIGLFYLGIPKGPLNPGKRRPITEKVTWIK